MWHVSSMDNHFIRSFKTMRECVKWCKKISLDGRKGNDLTRVESGFYEYRGPIWDGGDKRSHYYIGDTKRMKTHGFHKKPKVNEQA
jgi:hypothetical protein